MKKFIAMLLALAMVLSFAGCAGSKTAPETTPATEAPATEAPVVETEAPATEAPVVEETEAAVSFATTIPAEDVISYEEYVAAELDSPVVVETCIQAKQSWWNDQATFYTQNGEGGYFIYNMPCSEEDYNNLTVGTWIRVSGFKAEWAGEVEIIDAQFEIIESENTADGFVDVTALIGTEELINYQNQRVFLKDAVLVASTNAAGEEVPFMYGWDGSGEAGTDADLYFNVEVNGQVQTLVFEYYMCDAEGNYGDYNELYSTIQGLEIGAKLDIHAFLYWYEGAQPHVSGVMVVG